MVSKVTVVVTSTFDFFCYIISINEEVHDRKRKDAEYQWRMLIEDCASGYLSFYDWQLGLIGPSCFEWAWIYS